MYVCMALKQTRTMFVLDFPPCLNSQKQNIRGTHNYAVAEKSSSYFPQNRWKGNIEEGGFNTQ